MRRDLRPGVQFTGRTRDGQTVSARPARWEGDDMDEWELEVLGETWKYVTILPSESCFALLTMPLSSPPPHHVQCPSGILCVPRSRHRPRPPPPVLSQRSSDFCPNHHRHADELDRVARADPHVQFFDCQGHRAERLISHEVLQSMYPAEPPSDAEIMDPKYDHTPPPYQP